MPLITLIMGNSYSRIVGLNQDQMKALRKELSYKLDYAAAAYIPNPANHIKYCIDLKGNFASGLMHRVTAFIKKHDLKVQYVATEPVFARPQLRRAFKLTTPVVMPYHDQSKALEAIINSPRGIISLPTGTGKSMVIAMLLVELKLRTVIIVPTLELKQQLTESLKSQLTSMEGVIIENTDSNALNDVSDYDCLIIDEAHHVAAKTYHKLNKSSWNHIPYRYMFTATPFRNNSEETLLFEGIAGQIIYELSYQDAVKAGYIVPIEAYYLEVPKSVVKGEVYAKVYSELVVNNESRNLMTATLLARLWSVGKSVLCLVKEIKHGEILSQLTGTPFANGADENSREFIKDFSTGRYKALIGTTGLVGEGVDTKPCEYVIIAGLGKARSAFLQQVGRSVRKYPDKDSAKVIIFKDDSHKWTRRHFNEQKKILLDYYGVEVIKLLL